MNSFDAAVCLGLLIAIVTGFNAGLLRSAITILAYLIAMPIAVWLMALVAPAVGGAQPAWQNTLMLSGTFLIAGMVLGKLMRMAVDEMMDAGAGIGDRLAGAALGAARIGLVAITLVLVFDQLVPAGHEPAFLAGSRLRPLLSVAGQKGLASLPPEAVAAIDRLKRDQRI